MADALTTETGDAIITEAGDAIVVTEKADPSKCGFGLAEGAARLGITDGSKDAEINSALSASLGIVEAFLDRKLVHGDETEYFYDVRGHTIQLRRYPVDYVISASKSYAELDKEKGLIHFDGIGSGHEIKVVYSGGFCPIPAAILTGLWSVFDNVYQMVDGSAGGTVTAGAISSLSIPDVGTIKYATGGASAVASNPLTSVAYILEPFRRWQS